MKLAILYTGSSWSPPLAFSYTCKNSNLRVLDCYNIIIYTRLTNMYGSPGGTFITYDLFLITYYLLVFTYFLLLICYYFLLSY